MPTSCTYGSNARQSTVLDEIQNEHMMLIPSKLFPIFTLLIFTDDINEFSMARSWVQGLSGPFRPIADAIKTVLLLTVGL